MAPKTIDDLIERLKRYDKWDGQAYMDALKHDLRYVLREATLTEDQERKLALYGMKFILEGLM